MFESRSGIRGGHRLTTALFLLPALWATVSGLAAQGGGGLRVGRFNGELRFEAERRDEERSSRFSDISETEESFRENLKLQAMGSYYHPRLLEFNVMTDVGLEQLSLEQKGNVRERSVDSLNLAYDVQTRLFKEHPYTLNLYTLRNETQIRQNFFNTTEAVIMETGTTVLAKDWFIPSRFHYHYFTYDGRGADTNREVRENASVEGVRFDRRTRYQYGINYNNIELKSFNTGINDYDGIFSTTHGFGEGGRSNLAGTVRYREQHGAINTESMSLGGSTHLQHLDNLASDTSLEYDSVRTGQQASSSTKTTRGESVLRHELYQSLNTDIAVRGRNTDFDGGRINRYGGHLRLVYRKKIPIGGMHLAYQPDVNVHDAKSTVSDASVVDELHTYTPGIAIVLENAGVRGPSIIVSNNPPTPAQLIVYSQPTDYTVSTFAGRTRIDISVGSLIVSGQEILVDYVYVPQPDLKSLSVRQGLAFALRVQEWASLELGYSTEDQRLLSGVDLGILQNRRTKEAKVSLFHKSSSIAAEYEDEDSTFFPYERWGLMASTGLPVADSVKWNISADYFRTRFKDGSERESGMSAGTNVDWRIGRSATLRLRGEYRKIDLRPDEGEGFLFEGQYSYRFLKTKIGVEVLYSDEDFEVASDQRRADVKVTITRFF